jgi:hypothetical protein
MSGHISLFELQERLTTSRDKVFHDQGMSPKRRALLITMVISYIATTIASFMIRQDLRWTGLIPLAVEFIAGVLFYRDMRRSKAADDKEWLLEYDRLAAEDGETVDWIATFDRRSIVRSIETLKERALTEEMAFGMIFGPAAGLGMIAGLGILYTQADAILSSHLTLLAVALRAFIATLIAVMYVTGWKVTFQRTRRDRMKLILEFGLERAGVDLQDGTLRDGSAIATARPKVTS